MTDTAKTTLWVIIILILVGGIWWLIGSNPDQQLPAAPAVVEPVNVVATTTDFQVEDASTSISIQDKSDTAIDVDLNKVDDQLKALDTDGTK